MNNTAPLFLATVGFLVIACARGDTSSGTDWASRFQGWWDEGTNRAELCTPGRNLHRKTLSPDGKRLTYTYQHLKKIYGGREVQVISYEVLETEADTLTLFLEGETRRLPSGELVVWETVFVEPNAFRWRATTYPPGEFAPVWGVKCDAR